MSNTKFSSTAFVRKCISKNGDGAKGPVQMLLSVPNSPLGTEHLGESDQPFSWWINQRKLVLHLHPPTCATLVVTCTVPLLTTLYHFCARFADKFGTRAALILSCASGSAFFLLTSISTSIPLLFLSRLPAVFMHGLPGKVGQG